MFIITLKHNVPMQCYLPLEKKVATNNLIFFIQIQNDYNLTKAAEMRKIVSIFL